MELLYGNKRHFAAVKLDRLVLKNFHFGADKIDDFTLKVMYALDEGITYEQKMEERDEAIKYLSEKIACFLHELAVKTDKENGYNKE